MEPIRPMRIPCGENSAGFASLGSGLVYAAPGGQPLPLYLLRPWDNGEKHPLVVFIQGCSWTTPNPGFQLPQLAGLARRGFAVASVVHRDCREGHPFPAFLQDVKAAIRFLRAHAAEYAIDKERVAVWGTSSGGNAALLTAMTGDWDCYRTEDWPEESDRVQAVVDCFGPTDGPELLRGMAQSGQMQQEDPRMLHLISDDRGGISPEKIRAMSPFLVAEPGQPYPLFLLLHGDADPTVPFAQSEKLYERLCAYGYNAQLVQVTGGVHEGNFWSPEILVVIEDFLRETLQRKELGEATI